MKKNEYGAATILTFYNLKTLDNKNENKRGINSLFKTFLFAFRISFVYDETFMLCSLFPFDLKIILFTINAKFIYLKSFYIFVLRRKWFITYLLILKNSLIPNIVTFLFISFTVLCIQSNKTYEYISQLLVFNRTVSICFCHIRYERHELKVLLCKKKR